MALEKQDLDSITAAVKGEVAPILARVEALEKIPATKNFPLGAGEDPGAATRKVNAKSAYVKAEREAFIARDVHKGKGLNLAAFVRCMALASRSGQPSRLADVAHSLGYTEIADMVADRQKAMTEGVFADGGALVPPAFSSDFIELLRATAVVRSLNPVSVDMPNDTLTLGKQTGGATAAYGEESTNITESQPTLGQITLVAKKLRALVPISNDLLRVASAQTDSLVREDLRRVMANTEDLKFIRGTGASSEPKGLENWSANAIAISNATGTAPTLANVTKDIHRLIGAVEDDNVVIDQRCGFIGNPRTKRYLQTLFDGVGAHVYRDELLGGYLYGFPCRWTTQVPTNLSDLGGSDESFLIFAQFADVIVGDSLDMELTFQENAAYVASGSVVSGFSRDESAIRAISKHDMQVRHGESVGIMDQIRWTA